LLIWVLALYASLYNNEEFFFITGGLYDQ